MASNHPISNLFIATPSAIYLHCRPEKKIVFGCATSNGILNARASKDNSSLLAVADSHLVILHDSKCGRDRQYELKSGDVCLPSFCRSLRSLTKCFRARHNSSSSHPTHVSSTSPQRSALPSKRTRFQLLNSFLRRKSILHLRTFSRSRTTATCCFRLLLSLQRSSFKIYKLQVAFQYTSSLPIQSHPLLVLPSTSTMSIHNRRTRSSS
jgi:hypothetical protein